MSEIVWRFRYMLCLVSSFAALAQATMLELSPTLVRQEAIKSSLPSYPESSIQARHHGVTVAAIIVDGNGATSEVKILQSPDEAIAASVIASLKTWKFKPFLVGKKPTSFQCRLIFYFDLDGSTPRVVDAMRSAF